MNILEAISRRVSVRNYLPDRLEADELQQIQLAGEQTEALTSAELSFHICDEARMGDEVEGLFGDYGKVIRAPHYVVLAAAEGEGYLVDAGFRFEQLVLAATARGLGTCWVGGFFREPSLRAKLELDPWLRIVALTPIGRPAEHSLASRAIRAVAGSSSRKPVAALFSWQEHGAPLPPRLLENGTLEPIFEATRWAPSWKNKQPWRFLLTGGEVLIYKQARQLKEEKDYHLVDCGIAMSHFHLAARAAGFAGRWELCRFTVPGASDAEPIGKFPLEV